MHAEVFNFCFNIQTRINYVGVLNLNAIQRNHVWTVSEFLQSTIDCNFNIIILSKATRDTINFKTNIVNLVLFCGLSKEKGNTSSQLTLSY